MTSEQRKQWNNLEIGTKKPNLALMMDEIDRAMPRMEWFLERNQRALRHWQSQWDGQTADGRRHAPKNRPDDVFPFEGASDTRPRTVKQVIHDHVTLMKAAFNRSNIQAQTWQPLGSGRGKRSNDVSTVLKWQVNTQMRADLQRELPLWFGWAAGFGAAVLGVEWHQSRRLDYQPLNIPLLADVIAARDQLDEGSASQLFLQLQAAFSDPTQEQALTELIRSLVLDQKGEPVISRSAAGRIVRELGTTRNSEVPIPRVFKSMPRWRAFRIGLDLIFPDLTGNLQEEPWIAQYERVGETDLRDRIQTEDYDEQFVEAALEKRGPALIDYNWRHQAALNRSWLANDGVPRFAPDEDGNGVDLIHFIYKTVHHGTPCLYRTIFCPALVQRGKSAQPDQHLYALHGEHPYHHGDYPYFELVFEKARTSRPITAAQGIGETAYTWEQEMKTQADGMSDRTLYINNPVQIVPNNKVHAIVGQRRPGAVLGYGKPNETQFQELPPADDTPIETMRMVALRVQDYFGIFGNDIDPQKKTLRQEEVGNDVLGALNLAMAQTLQLDWQYLSDDEVSQIVGRALDEPWQKSKEQIRRQPIVTATWSAQQLDVEYAKSQLEMMGLAMQFNRNGDADMTEVFRSMLELINPDLADRAVQSSEVATDREKREEKAACIEMMQGSEPDLPMFANYPLRLQVMEQFMQQPLIMEQLRAMPQKLLLFENRKEMMQNQIQQYQENPGIGRALGTKTFQPKTAPTMALSGAAA